MSDIVVVQWSRLGDVLQTRVLLQRLRVRSPEARIVLSCDARLAVIARAFPEISELWPVDLTRLHALSLHPEGHRQFLQAVSPVLPERSRPRPTEVFVLSRSTAAVLYAELLAPEKITGYRRIGEKLAVPDSIREIEQSIANSVNVGRHLADIWASWSGNNDPVDWPVPLAPSVIRRDSPSGERRRVAIICDAGDEQRVIPGMWLTELLDDLLKEGGFDVVLIGRSASSKPDGFTLRSDHVPLRIQDFRGRTTLGELREILAAQDGVIGPDTGSLHLAAALGTAVIGLYFGGAICHFTGPYCPQAVVLQEPVWEERLRQLIIGMLRRSNAGIEKADSASTCFLARPRLSTDGIVFETLPQDTPTATALPARTGVERFHSRWQTTQRTRPVRAEASPKAHAPLVIVSEEPSTAAGSCLRWVWPLIHLGLREGRDFIWLKVGSHAGDSPTVREALAGAQVVVVFRPLQSSDVQKEIVERARASSARLLVDSDDLLLSRFPSPTLRAQKWQPYETQFRRLLEKADLITVSTESLRQNLQQHGYRSRHVPTHPHEYQRRTTDVSHAEDPVVRMGFMGNQAHLNDLGMILPALEAILHRHASVCFCWWGCRPGALSNHPQVRQGGPWLSDYRMHLMRLHQSNLDVVLVPLIETSANRARSPVKYFEFALAGCAAIYSAGEPYSQVIQHGRTGLLAEENTAAWVEQIEKMVSDEDSRAAVAAGAKQAVESLLHGHRYGELRRTLDTLGVGLTSGVGKGALMTVNE